MDVRGLALAAAALMACPPPGHGGTGGGAGGGPATRAAIILPTATFHPKAVASSDGALHVVYRTQAPARVVYGRCGYDCWRESSWQLVELASSSGASGSAQLAVGPDARAHVVYQLDGAFTYATCALGCDLPGRWVKTTLSLPMGCLTDGRNNNLALDATGGLSFITSDATEAQACLTTCSGACALPASWATGVVLKASAAQGRPAWAFAASGGTLHVTYDDGVDGLRYATCQGDCTRAASWRTSPFFFFHGASELALAAAADGRLHLAYNQARTPAAAPASVRQFDGRLLAWQCAGNCLVEGSWQGVGVGAAGDGLAGVSLLASGAGAVLVAAQADLTLHRCSSGCDASASWRSSALESAAERAALLPDPYASPGCTVGGAPARPEQAAWHPEHPFVALASDGAMLVHSTTAGLRTCPGAQSPTTVPGYGELLWLPP